MTGSGEAPVPRALVKSLVMTQTSSPRATRQAEALAARLEQGAQALAAFAASLTDAQWKTRCMPDGRTVGVIVHHVGFVYPIEIDIAQTIGNGKPLTGLTMDDVHALNARHAVENADVTRSEEHTSELQSLAYLVCRLLLEKKKKKKKQIKHKNKKNNKRKNKQYKR